MPAIMPLNNAVTHSEDAFAPSAQTSDKLLAATIRPKVLASFTTGWKKSSV